VEEPGRCDRYWELWTRRSGVSKDLATRPDEPRLSQLKELLADAELHLSAHLEVCTPCQAWLCRCYEISLSSGISIPV
jgi:hypothetical protein